MVWKFWKASDRTARTFSFSIHICCPILVEIVNTCPGEDFKRKESSHRTNRCTKVEQRWNGISCRETSSRGCSAWVMKQAEDSTSIKQSRSGLPTERLDADSIDRISSVTRWTLTCKQSPMARQSLMYWSTSVVAVDRVEQSCCMVLTACSRNCEKFNADCLLNTHEQANYGQCFVRRLNKFIVTMSK